MEFRTRKLVSPPDLNPGNTLFGGQLLRWIDEEVSIYTMSKLKTKSIVTKYMSEINFIRPAYQGDIIEIGSKIIAVGTSSITLQCIVQNAETNERIITIDKIVFVAVDKNGKSTPHGFVCDDL